MTDGHHRAAIAERAARAGGAVAREYFRGDVTIETKRDKNDVVTAADRDAQNQVVASVREEFPGDTFVCEEDAPQLAGPEHDEAEPTFADDVPETGAAWVVDPIDGTANFVRGMRTWTTSIAAVVDGESVGAATYVPAEGDLYAASPDTVTRDGRTMTVSERDDPETFAVAAMGRWPREASAEFGELCGALAESFGDVRRFGSSQYTLAQVADGALDAAVATNHANAWDTLAGVHLVELAGGTVTTLSGDDWSVDADTLVASNGECHDEVLDAARGAVEDPVETA